MGQERPTKISAAILGLFAAVKICRDEGFDVRDVLGIVEREVDAMAERGELEEKLGKEGPRC